MELSGSVLEWNRPRPPAMNIYDVQHLAETLELVRAPQVHEVDLEVRARSLPDPFGRPRPRLLAVSAGAASIAAKPKKKATKQYCLSKNG